MHDIDRTQLEGAGEAYEAGPYESGSYGELTEMESPFSEAEETELAYELLGVSSEEELDQFLGKLFKGVARGIGKVASFAGKALKPLGGVLKGIAKKALPFVGGALGSFIPIPGVGTAVGTALGGALSKALETEFEGMNAEDREFETAKRFVRLAGAAAKQVAVAQSGANPDTVAAKAAIAAARQVVPALGAPASQTPACQCGASHSTGSGSVHSGRWVRRGRKIILFGA